jgi:hypothetical protein
MPKHDCHSDIPRAIAQFLLVRALKHEHERFSGLSNDRGGNDKRIVVIGFENLATVNRNQMREVEIDRLRLESKSELSQADKRNAEFKDNIELK